jgi:hypothetical protein
MKKSGIALIVMFILLLLAIIAAIWGWYRPPVTISKTEFDKVPGIKATANIKKVRIPVKEIVTLDKKTVSEKLKLSEEITKDDKKQIIATAELEEPSEAKINIVAIMDKTTGESSIIAKQMPLSFFALENKRAVGLRMGYGSAAADKTQADIYGRWDVVRVGAIHLGLYGEVTTTGDGKAMLSVEYRF